MILNEPVFPNFSPPDGRGGPPLSLGAFHKVRQHFIGGEESKFEKNVMTEISREKSADLGKGKVKNSKKSADVLYGRPPWPRH
jgi:hypothetical protein